MKGFLFNLAVRVRRCQDAEGDFKTTQKSTDGKRGSLHVLILIWTFRLHCSALYNLIKNGYIKPEINSPFFKFSTDSFLNQKWCLNLCKCVQDSPRADYWVKCFWNKHMQLLPGMGEARWERERERPRGQHGEYACLPTARAGPATSMSWTCSTNSLGRDHPRWLLQKHQLPLS